MAEYFDTKAAINALVRLNNDSDMPTDWHKGVSSALSCLYRVPTVQPERKKGKWKNYIEDGYLECPFCGAATNCDGDIEELHFCFSCGAEMECET